QRLDVVPHELVRPVQLRLVLRLGCEIPGHHALPSTVPRRRLPAPAGSLTSRIPGIQNAVPPGVCARPLTGRARAGAEVPAVPRWTSVPAVSVVPARGRGRVPDRLPVSLVTKRNTVRGRGPTWRYVSLTPVDVS